MSRFVLTGTLNHGDIALRDGVIDEVGTVSARRGDTRADVSGTYLTPGLVDAHDHLFQRFTRGVPVRHGLRPWLEQMWQTWHGLKPGDVHAAAVVALQELALSGVTTVVDHHYLVPDGRTEVFDEVLDAARAVGLRLTLARGIIDRGSAAGGSVPDWMVEDIDAALAHTAALHTRLEGEALITIAVAPGSLLASSKRLYQEAASLAQTLGTGLHTHLAETRSERASCRDAYGCSPTQLLDEVGALSDRTWVAHGIHLELDDVDRLAAAGASVAHCPSSNLNLGSGVADVPSLLDADIPVALGSDGCASLEIGILPEAKLAAQLARGRLEDPHGITAMWALERATTDGRRALGQDARGIVPGAPADLALWAAGVAGDDPSPLELMVHRAARPRHVLVDGSFIVRDGRLCGQPDLYASRSALAHRQRDVLVGG